MQELIRSSDPVFLSWLTAQLREAGLFVQIFDGHTNAAFDGALDGLKCRVMVNEADLEQAQQILDQAPHAPG